MTSSRSHFSLGALAVVLCLALPMGVLSLFAPATTSDELASADAVMLARVVAVQNGERTAGLAFVVLEVEENLVGGTSDTTLTFILNDGERSALRAGDTVLALVGFGPHEILGAYQVRKEPAGLVVTESVTGFWGEGLPDTGEQPLEFVVEAFKSRLGLLDPSEELPDDGSDDDVSELGAPAGDFLEPNDDLASASPVFLNPPVPVTGTNPTKVTGLNLTDGDIDFFGFEAIGLTILHAETMLPADLTGMGPDTLISLFDATSGDLLASDDDSGKGSLSRLVAPLEMSGVNEYAVAVEGAATEGNGTSTGPYELQLELEQAQYLSNTTDLIIGVSSDGTFIEDFIGYKEVNGPDVLLVGVPADGWGFGYEIPLIGGGGEGGLPSGLTGVFAVAGDFLVQPQFNQRVRPLGFELGPFTDMFGQNRSGRANASAFVPSVQQGVSGKGMTIDQNYKVSVNQQTVWGDVRLKTIDVARIRNVLYERLLDIDMFDEGGDTMTWSFPDDGNVMAYPVPTTDTVGALSEPSGSSGSMTGDLQAAIVGRSPQDKPLRPGAEVVFPIAITLVHDFATEDDALNAAGQNLLSRGVDAWVIATDDDPDTGLFSAFGFGIAGPNNN